MTIGAQRGGSPKLGLGFVGRRAVHRARGCAVTTKLFGSAILITLLGACVAVAQEPALLLVHGPAEVAGATPTWCYSTLAAPDCYTQPIPDANDRLIAAYLPVEAIAEPLAAPEPVGLGHRGNGDIDRCRDHHRGNGHARVCEHSEY